MATTKTVQNAADGSYQQYNPRESLEQIAEDLRSQGFVGHARIENVPGFCVGYVTISDEGDVDWRAA